ncbi:MAG: hypothetical protein HZB51_34390 [Chloroflexi bacterium]|nr:hypothetical protein [Chloroflexota bacterium]
MTAAILRNQPDDDLYEIGVMQRGPYLKDGEIHIPHRFSNASEAAQKWAHLHYSPNGKVIYPARWDAQLHEYVVRTSKNKTVAEEQLQRARDEFYRLWHVLDARVCKPRKFKIVYKTLLETLSTVEIESELASSAIEQVQKRVAFKTMVSITEGKP